jgi:hypothetical protein
MGICRGGPSLHDSAVRLVPETEGDECFVLRWCGRLAAAAARDSTAKVDGG